MQQKQKTVINSAEAKAVYRLVVQGYGELFLPNHTKHYCGGISEANEVRKIVLGIHRY